MKAETASDTVHATAFVLGLPDGPHGLIVSGSSGFGKSSLALSMIDEWHRAGRFAAMVADDRVHLEAVHDRLIARAPAELAGLAERRGLGIVAVESIPHARIHMHLRLGVAPERMPEPVVSKVRGVALPTLDLPRLDGPLGLSAASILRAALQRRT